MSDVFEESDPFKITLKAGSGYDAPWITISGKSAEDVHDKMEKDDGAWLLKLMRTVSGAAKAFNATYTGKEVPESRTQGKPATASTPSPEKGQDPFKPEPVDDSPPFADSTPATPSCKHGERTKSVHKGKTYYTCSSDLPKGDPGRCAVIVAD